MNATKASALILLISAVVVGLAAYSLSSTSGEVKLETLFQNALHEQLASDREVFIHHVTMPPNSALEWHRHPGEEYHYYLEGEVTIEIEGQESIKGVPGTVGHVPYRKRHRAVTGEEGAKALVFRVHEADEPVRYMDTSEAKTR